MDKDNLNINKFNNNPSNQGTNSQTGEDGLPTRSDNQQYNMGDDRKPKQGGRWSNDGHNASLKDTSQETKNPLNQGALYPEKPIRNEGKNKLENNGKIQTPNKTPLNKGEDKSEENLAKKMPPFVRANPNRYNQINNPEDETEEANPTNQSARQAIQDSINDAKEKGIKDFAQRAKQLASSFSKSGSVPGESLVVGVKAQIIKKLIPIVLILVLFLAIIGLSVISSVASGQGSAVSDIFDTAWWFGEDNDGEIKGLDNKHLKKILKKLDEIKKDFTEAGKSFDHIMIMATINAIIENDSKDKIEYNDFDKGDLEEIAEAVSGKSDEEIKAALADNIVPKYLKLKNIEGAEEYESEVEETPQEETPQETTTSKGYKIENRNGVYYINDITIANKSYSVSSSYNPGGLSEEFKTAFGQMQNDASNKGIKLEILNNGFRSYEDQQKAYNTQVNEKGSTEEADKVSSRPGHSEHQLGNTADINSLKSSFADTTAGQWLNNNCYKYGFIIRYPKGKDNYTGYEYEPWHIRYVGKELAKELYNNGDWITLEEYLGITSDYNKPASLESSDSDSETVVAKNKNTAYYKVAEDAIELRDMYYELIGRENSCITGGSCNYTIPGFKAGGKSYNKNISVSNLKVRLMQCPKTGGTYGKPLENEELIDFEKYVLGTAYGEIDCTSETTEDYFKTQLVAVRSFALSRPDSMGNQFGLKLEEENGQWILQLRGCTDDQQYCDPDRGCSKDPPCGEYGESCQIWSGLDHKVQHKPPLSQDSKCRKWASETMGEVLVDSNGFIMNTGYKSKEQAIFKKSTNYKQTLLSHYTSSNTIEKADCNAGGESSCAYGISTGDYANWSQKCPECKSVTLGHGTATVYDYGCAATSIAMLIAKSGADTSKIEKKYNQPFNHLTFVKAMTSIGGFNNGGSITSWAKPTELVPDFVFVRDSRTTGGFSGNKQQKIKILQDLVNQGYYVVLEVRCDSDHFVALDTVQNGHVYVMDPATKYKEIWTDDGKSYWTNPSCSDSYRVYRKV